MRQRRPESDELVKDLEVDRVFENSGILSGEENVKTELFKPCQIG
jgi:hypothetical protein